MSSAKVGAIVPNIAFKQGSDGVSSWKTNGFVYDIAYPERCVAAEEMDEIINEVMVDDVYRLQKNTKPGDVWVDAGCHVGLFSIAAMQAGARVHAAIEAHPDIAPAAQYNLTMFKSQSTARGYIKHDVVDPFVFNDHIEDAAQLTRFNIEQFHSDVSRKCLKMDIQHSENEVLASHDAHKLANSYDLLVLEYHDEITSDISILLENLGWNITSITAHKDVQLCIPTVMIWAESG